MRRVTISLVLCFPVLLSCSEGTGPRRTRVPACDPILGFQLPSVEGYFLTEIDDALPPQDLTLGSVTYPIAAGQLALDLESNTYLWAFYTDAANPRFGTAIIGGQTFAVQSDGTLHLLVSNDSSLVSGVVSFSSDSAVLQVATSDLPQLGNANKGEHMLEYMQCP